MKMRSRSLVITALSCAVILIAVLYALFHGYLDRGRFEIRQSELSSTGRVAVVVNRSDRQAMSSYIQFILIGDHLFSASELPREYHSNRVVFAAAADCLELRWDGPKHLVVTCEGSSIDVDRINSQ